MEQPHGRGIVSDVNRGRGLVCIIVKEGELKVGDRLNFTVPVGEPRRDEPRNLIIESLRWQTFEVPSVSAGSTAEVHLNAFGVELPAYGSEISWASVIRPVSDIIIADAEAAPAICWNVDDDGAV